MCTLIFIEALFSTAKNLKIPKYPSVNKKENVIHTHTHTHTQEYYSPMKKKGILLFATTWMKLKHMKVT